MQQNEFCYVIRIEDRIMDSYSNIIKGVRKNEMRSQIAFYDLFYQPAYQSAYAILGNHDDAEEVMHDTLLKIFSNTGLLKEDAMAMTRFLKRITVNQAIDALRKRKDFILPFEDDGSMDIEAEEDAGYEYELTVPDIKEGIEQLSPAYRDIISLRLFKEMSFAEIAGELDINPSTARVQYTRGIKKLRALLQQKIDSYE